MITNDHIINKIFADKNINKDERYTFLIFISIIKDSKDTLEIPINTLMEAFESKGKAKLLNIIRSLENKGYIEILKTAGKANKYRLIKSYSEKNVNNDCCKSLSTSTYLDMGTSVDLDTTSSSNLDTSVNLDMGTSSDLDTSSSIDLDTSIDLDMGTSIDLDTGSSAEIATSTDIDTGIKHYEKQGLNIGESLENTKFNTCEMQFENRGNSYSDDLNNNIYINNNNNIYINNNNNIYINNKLYIYIFNTWNKTSINTEKVLSTELRNAIYKAVSSYGEVEIIKAIKNYSEVFYSQHYYNYRWNLTNFLAKPNAAKRFFDTGDMYLDYKSKFDLDASTTEDIDIQAYID